LIPVSPKRAQGGGIPSGAWLGGYRRLTLRYERHGHLFAAFLATTLTCYKKLAS